MILRHWRALLALALVVSPMSTALHLVDQGKQSTTPQNSFWMEEEPPVETEIYPADEQQKDVVRTWNPMFNGTFDEVQNAHADLSYELGPGQPLTLYRDGLGADPSFGGYGPWRMLGTDGWELDPRFAQSGEWGFGSADAATGFYEGGVRSLLVTPELDLHTGSTAETTSVDAGVSALSVSGLWKTLFHDGVPTPSGRRPLPQVDDPYQFQFTMRHNLANNMDQVTLVLFEKPPVTLPSDLTGCSPPAGSGNGLQEAAVCHVVTNYTGFSGRNQQAIDLTPWAGQSVWMGFYFLSGPIPSSSYFQGSGFVQSAGFYGFELDDVQVMAAASRSNLYVRPFDAPTTPVRLPEAPGTPILPVGKPVDIATWVVNTGAWETSVLVETRLQNLTSGETVANWTTQDVLQPGQPLRIAHTVDPLPEGRYLVETDAVHIEEEEASGNKSVVTSLGLGETDETDNSKARRFDVRPIKLVEPGEALSRSRSWVKVNEPIEFGLPVENLGNEDVDIRVIAHVVDITDLEGPPETIVYRDDFLTNNLSQIDRVVTLDALETTELQWRVEPASPGQFAMVVRFDEAPAPDADDFVPTRLKPWTSTWTNDPIDVNGALDELAWKDAVPRRTAFYPGESASGSKLQYVDVRILNNDTQLFVSITFDQGAPAFSDFQALFDDQDDGVATPGAEDGISEVGGDLHLGLDGTTFVLDNKGLDGGSQSGSGAQPALDGETRRVIEFSRPINASAGSQDLTAGPGDRVGMFLKYVSGQVHRFPSFGGVEMDGEAFLPPNGDLSDEFQGWQSITLAHDPDSTAASLSTLNARTYVAGFGVERSPPPFLAEGFSDCGRLGGWGQFNVAEEEEEVVPGYDRREKWNCGWWPEADQYLIYEGLDDTSTCGGDSCPPYSRLAGEEPKYGELVSPALHVPPGGEPYMWLSHHYSTLAVVADESVVVETDSGDKTLDFPSKGSISNSIYIEGVARVYYEEWDELLERWTNPILLLPDGSYSTEKKWGLDDPERFGPGGRNVAIRTGVGQQGAAGDACRDRDGGALSAEVRASTCGWWSPTGVQVGYRERGSDYAYGAQFDSPPWTVDRIPLVGQHGHGGTTDIDARGKDIRLRFYYDRSYGTAFEELLSATEDYGWRLGGLVVSDSERAVRDLSVVDLRPRAVSSDPYTIGVAPEQDLTAEITIRNDGLVPERRILTAFDARTAGFSGPSAPSVCSDSRELGKALLPGETITIPLTCTIDPSAEEEIRLQASVTALEGDDFPYNDNWVDPTTIPVREVPQVAVAAEIEPPVSHVGSRLTLGGRLENQGNVPLADLTITMRILEKRSGEFFPVMHKDWTVTDPLPGGASLALSDPALGLDPPYDPSTDAVFIPESPGQYRLVLEVSAPDDVDPSDNTAVAAATVLSSVLHIDNDEPTFTLPGVAHGDILFDGTSGVWSRQPGSYDGRMRLLAGNPETGELPPDTDAWVTLPEIDFTTLKDAALTVTHQYDLEESFDAARFEVSTDGGDTWMPLQPSPSSVFGLPAGFPETDVTGSSALVTDQAVLSGEAFTGDSGLLPNTDRGWLTSSFDLNQIPQFRVHTNVEAFSTANLANRADELFYVETGGDRTLGFRNASWILDEPGAEETFRYWWVHNVSVDSPQPHSGEEMVWSGFAGEASEKTGQKTDRIISWLVRHTDLTDVDIKPGERLHASWWDWRPLAGEIDMEGVGGRFGVYVTPMDTDLDGLSDASETTQGTNPRQWDSDGDGWSDGIEVYQETNPLDADHAPEDPWPGEENAYDDPDGDFLSRYEEAERGGNPGLHPVTILDRSDGGWVHRSIDLTDHVGQDVSIQFKYYSIPDDDYKDPKMKANKGWFIDDFRIAATTVDSGPKAIMERRDVVNPEDFEEIHFDSLTGSAGPWATLAGRDYQSLGRQGFELGPSPTRWTIRNSPPASDGGWQAAPFLEVPGAGVVSGWRFAGPNEQGYPHNADSRLVTPMVDLRRISDEAAFVFDHRYAFEHRGIQCPKNAPDSPRCFTSAVDGGIVEYQVYDPVTQSFGPWTQLTARAGKVAEPVLLSLVHSFGQQYRSFAEGTQTVAGERIPTYQVPAWNGYTAIQERGRNIHRSSNDPLVLYSQGSPFPLFEGRGVDHPPSSSDGDVNRYSLAHLPVSLVFGGQSEGTDGWEHVEWDISQLAGKQVRFSFRSWSNPSYTGSEPLEGWTVANILVEGKAFKGDKALLRARVATDGSWNLGAWSLDDLAIVGERYGSALILHSELEQSLSVAPGNVLEAHATLSNLGEATRTGLIITARAVDTKTGDLLPGLEIQSTGPLQMGEFNPAHLPQGYTAALGPFSLAPGGEADSSVPIELRLPLPDREGERINVELQIFEDVAKEGAKETPNYERARSELSGGTKKSWTVETRSVKSLALISQDDADGEPIRLAPFSYQPDSLLEASATVMNDGTMEAFSVTAEWSLLELARKGGEMQPGISDVVANRSVRSENRLDSLARGETWTTSVQFPVADPGLYRLVLEAKGDGKVLAREARELLVGQGSTYLLNDFSKGPLGGWTSTGDGPPMDFHQEGGALLWGVSDSDFSEGKTYCSAGGCNVQEASGPGASGPSGPLHKEGLNGMVVGPLTDLGRVPGSRANLILRHAYFFESPGDGGIVEVLPLRPSLNPALPPQPAFVCASKSGGGTVPVWFRLLPEDTTELRGIAYSHNQYGGTFINPIAPAVSGSQLPVFGGPAATLHETVLPLDRPTTSVQTNCKKNADSFTVENLVNYTLQIRFQVGTLPGVVSQLGSREPPRFGAQGWQIPAMTLTSADLDIQPRGHLSLPVRDGMEKEVPLMVTNHGPVPETVRLEIPPAEASSLVSTWLRIPPEPVTVHPGETERITLPIEIPLDPAIARGQHSIAIRAVPTDNPLGGGEVRITLDLLPNPLPDLSAKISTDDQGSGGPPTFTTGTVAPLHMQVQNTGGKMTRATTLELTVSEDEGESYQPVATWTVPPLCPASPSIQCGDDPSRHVLLHEWGVPKKPGSYLLRLEADADAIEDEDNQANNIALMQVEVQPVQRPDVAVTQLVLDGVPLQGPALAGTPVVVRATVSNLGHAAAEDVEVLLLSGSTPLRETRIVNLGPGDSREVNATKILGATDEVVFSAIANVHEDLDLRVGNNQLSRLVRIHNFDLDIAGPAGGLAIEPGTRLTFPIQLTNRGNDPGHVTIDVHLPGQTWAVHVLPDPSTVLPNRSREVTVTIEAPPWWTAGNETLRIDALSSGVARPLGSLELPLTVEALPTDLAVETANTTVRPGNADLPLKFTNRGNAWVEGAIHVEEPYTASAPPVRIAPATSVETEVALMVPPSVPAGQNVVNLTLVGEDGTPLLSSSVDIWVEPYPFGEIRWSDITAPTMPEHGRTLEADAVFANTGNIPLQVVLSPIQVSPGYEVQIAPENRSVEPGQTVEFAVAIRGQRLMLREPYGFVDAWGHRINNDTQVERVFIDRMELPTLPTGPDLQVRGVTVSPAAGVRQGSILNVTVEIQNRGDAPSQEVPLMGFADNILVDTDVVPALESQETTTVHFLWRAGPAGSHLLTFVVAPPDGSQELDSADNAKTVELEVEEGPSGFSIPTLPNLALVLGLLLVAFAVRRREPGGRA